MLSAKFLEHVEVFEWCSCHSVVCNPVEIKDPCQLDFTFVSEVHPVNKNKNPDKETYVWVNQSAIILNIFLSVLSVSSKPGVSTRTILPILDILTSAVHGSRSCPTMASFSVSMLTNYTIDLIEQ
jgi:hypothetical protein